MTADASEDGFHVARWVDVFGGLVSRHQRLWTWLGDQETRFLSDEIGLREIEQPIYVSGLARSGSTILLEALARHPDVATQRYKDYPPIFTPVLWNRFLDRTPQRPAEAAERTHKDGILVTPESPEAFEEVLWMASFPDLHDPMRSAVLDGGTSNPAFERFYKNHIRKLLLVRGGRRYLSKGNYNLTRLEYLLKLFPDVRFVIPVRDPTWHVASLMKQHALFCKGQRRNPAALRHLQRVGHFEFGLDRRPINLGDPAHVAEVLDLWQRGEEVEGWARYWSQIHEHVADRLEANGALARAALVVRFEELCRAPRKTLRAAFEHCRLAGAEALVEELAGKIRFPSYYRPKFTAEELRVIDRATGATALRFGYEDRATLASSRPQVA
ncbi:MAG: sulfotransferase family protein [Geminicoccaceae bacterium]